MSGKNSFESGLMHSTDEYRRKIETAEAIDKSKNSNEFLGNTLWKANLRNYHQDPNYNTKNRMGF